MSKSYVIQWKSKLNGRAGRGTKLFDWDEAVDLAEELNAGYPDIQHEVVAFSPEESPVAIAAEAESESAALPAPQTNLSPDHAFSFE